MPGSDHSYLHGTLVNQETIELCDSFVGAAGFVENDRCNATANAIGTVGDHGALHRANSLSEVFLYERSLVPN